jgi:hypothetical protein
MSTFDRPLYYADLCYTRKIFWNLVPPTPVYYRGLTVFVYFHTEHISTLDVLSENLNSFFTRLLHYRPIFNSWQSGSGALHAAPFPPMGFVIAARSRDPIKWVGAPHHVTCHVTLVCTLPSLRSDTPWRMDTSLGLIRPADRVCNVCRSSVTWPL